MPQQRTFALDKPSWNKRSAARWRRLAMAADRDCARRVNFFELTSTRVNPRSSRMSPSGYRWS